MLNGTSPVLRGEGGSNVPDLPDQERRTVKKLFFIVVALFIASVLFISCSSEEIEVIEEEKNETTNESEYFESLEWTFNAKVIDIYDVFGYETILVEPLEENENEVVLRYDKIAFGTTGLEDIGISIGDIVSIISDSFIMESNPAKILVTNWEIIEKAEQ